MDNDVLPGVVAQNLPNGFQTIQTRHIHVQDHDVGFELSDFLHGFPAITGFPTHLPASMGCNQRTNVLSDDFMVIGNQDPECSHRSLLAHGFAD